MNKVADSIKKGAPDNGQGANRIFPKSQAERRAVRSMVAGCVDIASTLNSLQVIDVQCAADVCFAVDVVGKAEAGRIGSQEAKGGGGVCCGRAYSTYRCVPPSGEFGEKSGFGGLQKNAREVAR